MKHESINFPYECVCVHCRETFDVDTCYDLYRYNSEPCPGKPKQPAQTPRIVTALRGLVSKLFGRAS